MLAIFLVFPIAFISAIEDDSKFAPEQIHISVGSEPNSLGITWATKKKAKSNYAEVCGSERCYNFSATTEKLREGILRFTHEHIHKALATNLYPSSNYTYRVGNSKAVSEWLECRTLPEGNDWSPTFAVYGDMGIENAQSLPRIISDAEKGEFDAVLHVGDFAYNLWGNDGVTGDLFMNAIQPVASKVPYMTCPGNHEYLYDFRDYVKRFYMPGPNPHYYSWNVGPVHIISLNSEFYIEFTSGIRGDRIAAQYEWLQKDLAEATANRDKQPWIIVIMHRPFYCSSSFFNCQVFGRVIRNGWLNGEYALENLFYNNGVDLILAGHLHNYERFFPIYEFNVLNGTEAPYTNPGATVQIISGSAGCKEGTDALHKKHPLAAFTTTDYGYGKMKVFNSSHLYWEQLSDNQDGKVIDSMWLIKDSHGPFGASEFSNMF